MGKVLLLSLSALMAFCASLPFLWLVGSWRRLHRTTGVVTGFQCDVLPGADRPSFFPEFQFRLSDGTLAGCVYRFGGSSLKKDREYVVYVDPSSPGNLFCPSDMAQWTWVALFLAPAAVLAVVAIF